MPKYLPKLMKHICRMLAEHASTSHVTYMLHHVNPKGQNPKKKEREKSHIERDHKDMRC